MIFTQEFDRPVSIQFDKPFPVSSTRKESNMPYDLEELIRTVLLQGELMNNGVYCIFNPDSLRPPTIRYNTEDDAQREAVRLANAHPGHKFYVMKAVSVSTVQTVVTTRL